MKGMTVKAYLETVAKICTFEEAAGRCSKSKKDGIPCCPLWDYQCGIPTTTEEINAVIEIVAKYKMPPKGGCVNCGADIRDLRETQKIKYCPFCGEGVRENK